MLGSGQAMKGRRDAGIRKREWRDTREDEEKVEIQGRIEA